MTLKRLGAESARYRLPSLRVGFPLKRRLPLADESSGPRGHLLGVPVDGNDPTVVQLKADIRKLAGRTALLETGDAGGAAGGGTFDLKANRLGPEPTGPLVELMTTASREIYAACGCNAALFESAPGVAMREANRQLLFSTVAPLGKLVAAELTAKLNTPITFDWEELRASDIAGRARAFGSMVQGGMDLAKAAALSGLMVED